MVPDARTPNVKSSNLRGTLAVITGGASGIGYALANAYGQRGASVLIADRDEPDLKTAHARRTDEGIETHTQLVDLCDAAAVGGLARGGGPIGARGTGARTLLGALICRVGHEHAYQ
jgi:NAD(P)-dependent dehydrogenase (short-subunit alcohol dehydrogenase family)